MGSGSMWRSCSWRERAAYGSAEVPIDWYYQTESKIRPVRDTFRMLADVLSVRWNSLLGNYRRASSVDERPEGSQESDR